MPRADPPRTDLPRTDLRRDSSPFDFARDALPARRDEPREERSYSRAEPRRYEDPDFRDDYAPARQSTLSRARHARHRSGRAQTPVTDRATALRTC
jgi:hypothetical protein